MSFNPFQEKGTPVEKQFYNFLALNTKPYDSRSVHPYSRMRGILMNGIESEAVFFYHNFHRHCNDMDLRREIAMVRRAEQEEQKMVNWLIPGEESVLEVTIGYEQLAVDLTASMAKNEPDPYVKAALDFALLEDFDHLYRFANFMLLKEGKRAEKIVKELTEITPGRPTAVEHRHPFDTVFSFSDSTTADPLTQMHIATITAAEQQTMNFYMNMGNRQTDMGGRGLYQEIALIEEEHVTQYGSLGDPRLSWFEMAVLHEYNECYLYWSCMQSEPDERVKKLWEQLLMNEIGHLSIVSEWMKKYEKKPAAEMYPGTFPRPLILESSKEYVRRVIAEQFHLTGDMEKIVPLGEAKSLDRFEKFQTMVNTDGKTPSQEVVADTIRAKSEDYRWETEGENPIEFMRNRKEVPSRETVIEHMKEFSHAGSAV
jgi:rubrerythrin